ncbi:hypothetical protein [Micromonospora siamensis]|uniref:Uncharacterized protein n=1 Tax=Micromonospora siamensis TaxID=299152 RepID=A0A1C5HUF2_9ACTN|nr:hypothetical protein [Micromonospora siamensis]SCG49646.1 hypothetical protein GA0074704_2378 [Micromonospora siamensis]
MPDQPDAATLEAAHMAVLQMFGAVCAEPDNPTVAEQADQALWRLDDLLAAAAS